MLADADTTTTTQRERYGSSGRIRPPRVPDERGGVRRLLRRHQVGERERRLARRAP